jgi:hypothetical protein
MSSSAQFWYGVLFGVCVCLLPSAVVLIFALWGIKDEPENGKFG